MKKRAWGHLLWIVLPLIIGTNACKRSVEETPQDPTVPGPGPTQPTNRANLTGIVTNSSGQPVAGAQVSSGTATVSTDATGNFRLDNLPVSGGFTFIRVSQAGYLSGSRTISAQPNKNYRVAVELVPRPTSSSFSATTGGSITPSGVGGSISFTSQSVVRADGSAYTGNVQATAFSYDFSNQRKLGRQLPGTQRGITANGATMGLSSYAAVNTELANPNNQPLRMAPGATATLTLPIASRLRSIAPNSVALWYFNDSTGLWKEEGTATRQGNNYVGTVSHFTVWSAATAVPMVDFSMTLLRRSGDPVQGWAISIDGTGADSAWWGGGYTDSAGVLNTQVLANKVLRLRFFTECNGGVAYDTLIGPFTAATNLGTRYRDVYDATAAFIIRGTATDCGTSLTQGSVEIKTFGYLPTYGDGTAISGGQYVYTRPACGLITLAPPYLVQGVTGQGTSTGWAERTRKDTVRPQPGIPYFFNIDMCELFAQYRLDTMGSSINSPTSATADWGTLLSQTSLVSTYDPALGKTAIMVNVGNSMISYLVNATPTSGASENSFYSISNIKVRLPSRNGGMQTLTGATGGAMLTKYGAVGNRVAMEAGGRLTDSATGIQRELWMYVKVKRSN